ncbi:MAG: type II toxin-antitoxin system HicB family antitoxin [Candidatus Omnitrophica bacterium]|nr:type II toxin-antitoxin system HicB family antitoxin [Candidatus Omnitrophota bacterium]
MKYLIVIEETDTGFSAYSPDVDGCIATGATQDEVRQNMKYAMEFQFEGMRAHQEEIPKPRASSNYIDLGSPA